MKHPLQLPANIVALGAVGLLLANQVAAYQFASSEQQKTWALYIGFAAVVLALAGEF